MTYLGPAGPVSSPELAIRRRRPGSVTVAAIALYGVAGLGVISAILSFAEAGPAGDRVTTSSQDANAATVTLSVYGLIALITAAYFVLGGVFAMRGSRGMRIATWSVGGATVLCLGCNGLGNGVLASGLDRTTVDNARSNNVILDSQSHAYVVSTATIEIVTTLVMIVAIILLALPPSNAYFRKLDPMAAMYAAQYGYPAPGYAYPMPAHPQTGYPAAAYPPAGYPPSAYPPGQPQGGYPQWQTVPPPQAPPGPPSVMGPPQAPQPPDTKPLPIDPDEPPDSNA